MKRPKNQPRFDLGSSHKRVPASRRCGIPSAAHRSCGWGPYRQTLALLRGCSFLRVRRCRRRGCRMECHSTTWSTDGSLITRGSRVCARFPPKNDHALATRTLTAILFTAPAHNWRPCCTLNPALRGLSSVQECCSVLGCLSTRAFFKDEEGRFCSKHKRQDSIDTRAHLCQHMCGRPP